MEYTIGSVSDMFDIPASTLRFYDREGLFTDIPRSSGIRKFRESDVETLRIIECLKKTGLEIKDIKKFIGLCRMGKETYEERKKENIRGKENRRRRGNGKTQKNSRDARI